MARGCQWLSNRQQLTLQSQHQVKETNSRSGLFPARVIQTVIHDAWKQTKWVPRFGCNTGKPDGERASRPHHSPSETRRKYSDIPILCPKGRTNGRTLWRKFQLLICTANAVFTTSKNAFQRILCRIMGHIPFKNRWASRLQSKHVYWCFKWRRDVVWNIE